MCRLFASMRLEEAPTDRFGWLLAFFAQSRLHPDGWGMARFVDGQPQVIKEPEDASKSILLPRYLRWGKEPLLMAHIRQGSVGSNTMENTHPFLHNGWVFEHNGTFDALDRLKAKVSTPHLGELRGVTDSEVIFLLLLQGIKDADDPVEGISETVRMLRTIKGPKTTALNFIMSDGQRLYLLNSAFIRADYYALHYLADEDGRGMIFSSRPLDQNKGWTRLEKHTLLVVDRELKSESYRLA